LGDEQLQAKQADGAGAAHEHDIAELQVRDLANGMDGSREWLAQGPFLGRQIIRQTKELVGPRAGVAREGAIDAVTHPAPLRAKHEFTLAAIDAPPAGDRRSAKNSETFAFKNVLYNFANLDGVSGKLVSEDYWWIIAEGVVIDVEVSAADTASGDFNLYLIVGGLRLRDIPDFDVSNTGGEFNKGFHSLST
jgi:hypothetical protein